MSNITFGTLTIPEMRDDSLSAYYNAPAQMKYEDAKKLFKSDVVEHESGATLVSHFNESITYKIEQKIYE